MGRPEDKTEKNLLVAERTPGPEGFDDSRPRLYRAMSGELSSCASDGNKVTDAAFEVGTYHCACVLATSACVT